MSEQELREVQEGIPPWQDIVAKAQRLGIQIRPQRWGIRLSQQDGGVWELSGLHFCCPLAVCLIGTPTQSDGASPISDCAISDCAKLFRIARETVNAYVDGFDDVVEFQLPSPEWLEGYNRGLDDHAKWRRKRMK